MHDSHRASIPSRLAVSALAWAALAIGLTTPAPARARAFQIGCDMPSLRQALDEAAFNGEEDVLSLAPGCLYALDGILIAYPDGGLPVTIQGNGATISALSQRTAFLVNPGATLFLQDLTVTEGKAGPTASGSGGAIYNAGALTLTRCSVSDSEAFKGGGIFNTEDATLTLLRSTVSGNRAGPGGSLSGQEGGGIFNREGRVTLIDSTVSGNTANGTNGLGAGIYNDDVTSTPGRARVTLSNCTFSGNASRFGAGIFNDHGVVTVSHCTFASNDAVDGGNGAAIYQENSFGGAFLRLGNSILADNLGDGYLCARNPSLASNLIAPTGENLIEDASCQLAGAWSGDPKLGALTSRPAYHPLLAGSPVADLAPVANCAGTDQRGNARPKDANGDGSALCDLGAFEAP